VGVLIHSEAGANQRRLREGCSTMPAFAAFCTLDPPNCLEIGAISISLAVS
jgi:hypothetical protein